MKKTIFNLKFSIFKRQHSGFVLIFAVTVASILLALALGVANISLKEVKFSTSARSTNDAFFAADTGIEQALFNDKNPASYPPPASGTQSWSFSVSGLGSSGQSCASVTVTKESAGGTTIVSKGYNIGNALCTSSNPDRIERQLKVTYGDSSSLPPAQPPQTPLRTLGSNNLSILNIDINIGYRFTPTSNGKITHLAMRTPDNALHTVRLYDMSGNVLASSVLTGNFMNWVEAVIPSEVNVTAGTSYVVAVRTGMWYYQNPPPSPSLPQTTGNITINEARYSYNVNTIPTSVEANHLYGQPDVTFVPN